MMAKEPMAAATGEQEVPLFEPVNFTDLDEFIEAAQAGGDGSDVAGPLAVALKRGVQETSRFAVGINERLERLDAEVLTVLTEETVADERVADSVAGCQAFEDLHQEILATDAVFEQMERMLGTYQCELSCLSDRIGVLQGNSLQMNAQLRNRQALQKLMDEHVVSVKESSQLIRCIYEDEINEKYLGHLTELDKRLNQVTQIDMHKLPSCAQSKPELERGRTIALDRIKDFLFERMNELMTPNTNIQTKQSNLLVRCKPLNQFLAEHHAAAADEVKQHYVTTMSSRYVKRFRYYVASLKELEMENGSTSADMLVSDEWLTEDNFLSQLSDKIGLGSKTINIKDKGNVFALADRHTVLQELEKDPIAARSKQNNVKYYHEQLFRSHQKKLMDKAISELRFLCDFFNTHDAPMLLHEVLRMTKQNLLDSLKEFLPGCWDSVGLLLMIRIVESCRKYMQGQQVTCLDSYFDALQQQLWPRLECILKENTASLRKATQQGLTKPSNNTHGHLVTRRYAELAASLHALSTSESSLAEVEKPLQSMQVEARNLLETIASKIEGPETNAFIFLVNNCDLVLAIFDERHLQQSAKACFDELWREQVQKFVESQLKLHFADLVSFVTATEPLVQGLDENSARASVDVLRMDQVVRSFAHSWKQKKDCIHQNLMKSVQNLSTAMRIMQQVLEQLLHYHERLCSITNTCFSQQPPFQSELVNKMDIFREIKQYSVSF